MLSHCFLSCSGDYAKTRLKMGPAVSVFLQMKCVHMQTFPKQTFINVLLSVQTAGFLSQMVSTRCSCIALWHGASEQNVIPSSWSGIHLKIYLLCWNAVSRDNSNARITKTEFKWIHRSSFFFVSILVRFHSWLQGFQVYRSVIWDVLEIIHPACGAQLYSVRPDANEKKKAPVTVFTHSLSFQTKTRLQPFQMCPFRRG